jgi:hypothetical protein
MLRDEINKNKDWYFYGLEFGDDETNKFTSNCLIATDRPINSDKELLDYWSQIEPNLYFVYGHVIEWMEYSMDIYDDDAVLAEYIELMEV